MILIKNVKEDLFERKNIDPYKVSNTANEKYKKYKALSGKKIEIPSIGSGGINGTSIFYQSYCFQ
jgi:hypothetical protein